ncbi:MAG: hypothetical protein JXR23_08880 [Pontiellaceae bacterium]|nr:hypothetical protein [Pontiellaceae bacterium]
MKKKSNKKNKDAKKQSSEPVKGSIQHLSEYFGSYLSALEMVRSRQ